MQFQKISILPPQKGLEFLGGWGFSRQNINLKKCIKLNWNNFKRGGGSLPLGGMDIFWNYTVNIAVLVDIILSLPSNLCLCHRDCWI